MFETNESYLHKEAKKVLNKWLYEYKNKDDDRIKIVCETMNDERVELSWRENWSKPIEYPLSEETACMNWEEMNEYKTKTSYEAAILQKQKVVAVIDVVAIHKGSPIYLFEICHKNPVSKKKLEKINDCLKSRTSPIQYLIEIDATWIMSQTKKPSILKVKNIYSL